MLVPLCLSLAEHVYERGPRIKAQLAKKFLVVDVPCPQTFCCWRTYSQYPIKWLVY